MLLSPLPTVCDTSKLASLSSHTVLMLCDKTSMLLTIQYVTLSCQCPYMLIPLLMPKTLAVTSLTVSSKPRHATVKQVDRAGEEFLRGLLQRVCSP